MNAAFLRREWGAVTFVLTVLLGVVVVPAALYFGNQNQSAPVTLVSPTPSASATVATPARTGSPSPSVSPSSSP